MKSEVRRHKSRFWRICRIYFRRFRITVWLVLLTLLGALIYINQVGLPNFVKKPLLEKVRARGIDLQFSRLRWRWQQGIVAENVRFGRADDPASPQLTLGEVQVCLNLRALARFRVQVDSLALHQGRLVWPIVETNHAPRRFTLENIQTDLRFLPDDQWALDHFKAAFAGARIQLSGLVSQASAVRDWKIFHPERPAHAPAHARVWQKRLRQFADTLERIQFSTPPELMLDVQGDARDLRTFGVRLLLAAPGADTPWGAVAQGRFNARLFPAGSNGLSRAELKLEAANAQTPWATITNFQLGIELSSVEGRTNLVNGVLNLSAQQVRTEWAAGSNALLTAQWLHATTNPVPLSGYGQFQCDFARTRWGKARRVQFAGHFARPAARQLPPPKASWAWWTNLQPYQLDWETRLADFQSPKLAVGEIACSGSWRAPRLAVNRLHANLYDGRLEARAALNVDTRALDADLASDFDPHKIGPLLTQGGRRWLNQYSWQGPPQLNAHLTLVLPPWTNRQPDWRAEVQPTLSLQGEFNFQHGASYRQVQMATAHSHFIYSNMCWHLPDLTATRPEGKITAEHRANDRTRDYYWHLSSTVDPRILRPLLEPQQQRGLDLLTFTQPPAVEAEIWGRFHDHQRIGFKGRVALTNFTFRGQSAASLQTRIQYTNRFLEFFAPRIVLTTPPARAGEGAVGTNRTNREPLRYVCADGLAADFNRGRVYLTNGLGWTDPLVVARAIGPHIGRALEPYHFDSPVTARVQGIIPMHGEEGADLHFDIDGGPFHWWKFNLPHIAGHLHWLGQHLSLTNITADFYKGKAGGFADFDFIPRRGAEFQFTAATTNCLLQALMADLSTHTNHLAGWLNGSLTVTKANTAEWQSVNGYGDLELADGLIWDIPLFGVFTPVLNGISPGLGNSRASAGTCSFVITNGVLFSNDLEIRSPALCLLYRGTVDFESRVDARVDAEFLRDVWLFGPLVSTVFWPVTKMFEYKLSGSLEAPKADPVYLIPKLVQLPFLPLHALKGLLPEEAAPPPATNGPPAKVPAS